MSKSTRARSVRFQSIINEVLESRRLFSGVAPTAKNDHFTVREDTSLSLYAGVNKLVLDGHSYIWNEKSTFTDADGTFTAYSPINEDFRPSSIHLSFQANAGEPFFYLDFAAPDFGSLTPGTTYLNAERYPFQETGRPGLDLTGNYRGSNTVSGQFTIHDIGLDEHVNPKQFYATFEHHSEESDTEVVYGLIQYHYAAPGTKWGVLANDTDPEGDPLTARLFREPSHGLLNFRPDGTFDYVPEPDYAGPDSFTYFALDGSGQSAERTVSIDVTPVNDAPSFTLGYAPSVKEDSAAQRVRGFAQSFNRGGGEDEANQALTFTVTAVNPALFRVQPKIDPITGDLTYTPAANAWGVAAIKVIARDSGLAGDGNVNVSAEQTATFSILPVNDAPVAADDAYTTRAGVALHITPAKAQTRLTLNGTGWILDGSRDYIQSKDTYFSTYGGDSGVTVFVQQDFEDWHLDLVAPYGQSLRPGFYDNVRRAGFMEPGLPGLDLGGNGRGSNEVTGHFTIIDYQRTADDKIKSLYATFEHHSDGSAEDVVRGTVKINYVPPAGVLANDSDLDGDRLTAALVSKPKHGTLTLRADGSFDYVPAAGFTGVDSFAYTASDGRAKSAVKTVRITVGGVPPVTEASISGTAFNDHNKNGKFDAGDGYSRGVVVFIDADNDGKLDANERRTTTDAKGKYSFANLPAGTFRVRRVFPSAGFAYSTPLLNLALKPGELKKGQLLGTKRV